MIATSIQRRRGEIETMKGGSDIDIRSMKREIREMRKGIEDR